LRELGRRVGVSSATLGAVETGKTGLAVSRLPDRRGTTAAALLAEPATAGENQSGHTSPVVALDEPEDWRVFAPLSLDPVLTSAIAAFVSTGYHGARATRHAAALRAHDRGAGTLPHPPA
jgi:hypothetical protein